MARGPEVASGKISSARVKIYIVLHVCFAFFGTTTQILGTPVYHGISPGKAKSR
jgi:hypothetical protein